MCGVRDARVQKKLLAESDLTFKQAFDTALAMELAEKKPTTSTARNALITKGSFNGLYLLSLWGSETQCFTV